MTESVLQRSMRLAELSLEPVKTPPRYINHDYPKTGDTFGKWTVIDDPRMSFCNEHRRTVAPCKCSCGTVSKVLTQQLKAGRSTMCAKCANRAQARRIKFKEWQCKQELMRKKENRKT